MITKNMCIKEKQLKGLIEYTLTPSKGKKLRHKITGDIVKTFIILYSKKEIEKYEEID